MSLLIKISMACLLLVCASMAHAEEADLDALLDRVIEEYGGEENLRKLDNQVQRWDLVTLVGSRHGTDTRRIRVPDQLAVEITYPDRQETRIVSGRTAYFLYRDAPPRFATKPQKDAMRLQLMRHYSPLVLQRKKDSLSVGEQGGYHVRHQVELFQ